MQARTFSRFSNWTLNLKRYHPGKKKSAQTYEEQKIFSMLIISIEGCDSHPYNHPNMSLGLFHLPTKILILSTVVRQDSKMCLAQV